MKRNKVIWKIDIVEFSKEVRMRGFTWQEIHTWLSAYELYMLQTAQKATLSVAKKIHDKSDKRLSLLNHISPVKREPVPVVTDELREKYKPTLGELYKINEMDKKLGMAGDKIFNRIVPPVRRWALFNSPEGLIKVRIETLIREYFNQSTLLQKYYSQ